MKILKNTTIFSDKITYLKNEEKIFTEGVSALVENKYEFESKNVNYNTNNKNKLRRKIFVKDINDNKYELDKFHYQINERILKGNNIIIYSRIDKENIDKYYFSEGFDFQITLLQKILKLKYIKIFLIMMNKILEFMVYHQQVTNTKQLSIREYLLAANKR